MLRITFKLCSLINTLINNSYKRFSNSSGVRLRSLIRSFFCSGSPPMPVGKSNTWFLFLPFIFLPQETYILLRLSDIFFLLKSLLFSLKVHDFKPKLDKEICGWSLIFSGPANHIKAMISFPFHIQVLNAL